MRNTAFSFLLLLPLIAVAMASNLSDAEKNSRLRSGQIVHEYTRMDESGGSVKASIIMRTSVEAIWSVLQGCGKAFIFVDGLEQCEVISRSDNHARIHQVVDTGLLAPTLDYSYESINQAYTRMDFDMLEGNLRVLQGGWDFKKVPQGVLVTYNMRVRPSFPIPRFLVRMSLRRMIPDMLACIRALVDGSWSPNEKSSDLERCPGKDLLASPHIASDLYFVE